MTPDAPRIAVLDYGIGNLRSAQKALQHLGADAELTSDPVVVEAADAVVMPGVGAFGPCVDALRSHGLADVAVAAIASGVPFLGICVGMQMLYEGSAETADVAGLGVLEGKLSLISGDVKRPQMQWNRLDEVRPSKMTDGLPDEAWVYFVHSYCAPTGDDVVATCDYGGPVVAAVERGPLWATQFHPEKSGKTGLRILRNFVAMAETIGTS